MAKIFPSHLEELFSTIQQIRTSSSPENNTMATDIGKILIEKV